MSLKKSLNQNKAQSIIEYCLLVAIAVSALLAVNFILKPKNNAFETHFEILSYCTGGVTW